MSESQRQGPYGSQEPPKDPRGSKPPDPAQRPRQEDPCDDPHPPATPKEPEPLPTHQQPPYSPPEQKCPEKKPCPELPPPPPDPCAATDTGPGQTEPGKGADDSGGRAPSEQASPERTPTAGAPDQSGQQPPENPAAQLAWLQKELETRQQKLQSLEPLKASIGDITQRIQALEKMLEGQASTATSYREFYRSIEVARSEIECFIPTVRCQLDLNDWQKRCISESIAVIDARVSAARANSDKANRLVETLEAAHKRAVDRLAWIKQWHDFLKSGLQQQVTKQRDDLKTLKGLADPSKNQCEVWFYLYELERLIKSEHGTEGACWKADLSVGTYIDCWRWECYEQVWNKTIVTFNDAEANEKFVKSELEQAKKNAADLDKLAKEAESKRREWILKEIKARDCCGPKSKCPEGTSREGRAA